MRLPPYFRRSSSAPEAAQLGLAGSMTHSARDRPVLMGDVIQDEQAGLNGT
jgi:hypothetical protein